MCIRDRAQEPQQIALVTIMIKAKVASCGVNIKFLLGAPEMCIRDRFASRRITAEFAG